MRTYLILNLWINMTTKRNFRLDSVKKEYLSSMEDGSSTSVCTLYGQLSLTQPVRTLFLFISIWKRPQGSQGCQKIRFIFLQMKLLSFCTNIAPERHKLQKIIKIGKKCQKTPVFLDLFEYSSVWGQY